MATACARPNIGMKARWLIVIASPVAASSASPNHPDRTMNALNALMSSIHWTAFGEEAIERGDDRRGQSVPAQAAEEVGLQRLQVWRVADDGEDVVRERVHAEEEDPAADTEIKPVPDGRPDPVRPARAGVLRH